MRLKRLVARFQQDAYNRDRREQRLRDKLARELGKDEMIAQIHQEHEAEVQGVEAHHADDRGRSNKTINRLQKRVKRLQAQVDVDSKRIEGAVQKALKQA